MAGFSRVRFYRFGLCDGKPHDGDTVGGNWVMAPREYLLVVSINRVLMSDSPPTTDGASTTVPVTPELRDRLRVAKAESGQSYDDYLRENLSLSVE